VQLHTDENLWNQFQKNGVEIVNQIYNGKKLGESFMKQIKDLQEDLEQHRANNFLGSLLQYKMLQSTKYLSKWIETKNNIT
jgi:aspartate/tyrosine/aromatic aminotransferase